MGNELSKGASPLAFFVYCNGLEDWCLSHFPSSLRIISGQQQ
jgi:hypothetical protein